MIIFNSCIIHHQDYYTLFCYGQSDQKHFCYVIFLRRKIHIFALNTIIWQCLSLIHNRLFYHCPCLLCFMLYLIMVTTFLFVVLVKTIKLDVASYDNYTECFLSCHFKNAKYKDSSDTRICFTSCLHPY